MTDQIIACAKRFDADIVGFASASRFDERDPVFQIMPNVKTVIGLGFRVLRGIYRGVEEGTTYYQYTTMGVENLEETVMPLALINVSNLIEEEGFEALPQRKNQLIMNEENSTNPEMDYTDVVRGVKAENQIDFLNCAVQCGLGEKSMIGSLLTPEYGPFIRYCFILTDAELEPSDLCSASLCDQCGECIKACPGKAIDENGLDTWQCAVYYKGAHRSNPFMTEDFLKDDPNREVILNGEMRFDAESAREIYSKMKFLPNTQLGYSPCLCAKACDYACYLHLKGGKKQ
jgi:ferredoxin